MNLFITYRCNLACPYCFARDMQSEFPADMTPAAFEKLLGWLKAAPPPTVAFLGGEPTLHPQLPTMTARVAALGVAPIVFTNGLFDPALAATLAKTTANFVINYNEPSLYTSTQAAQLHDNLTTLQGLGAGITFSRNFSPGRMEYAYFLEGLERYGVRNVRYDISRASADGGNDHFPPGALREALAATTAFVQACEARGVRTGLDCSVRFCDMTPTQRAYLERVSMKFRGVCHPSMDVHPDLSASYCLPLRDVRTPDVTRFANQEALMRRLAAMARPLRDAHAGANTACASCADFRRRCQGGCLALRTQYAACSGASLPGALHP